MQVLSGGIDSWNWFGVKLFWTKLFGKHCCLAQAHRRFFDGGDVATGFGLLQVGLRHLLYVGRRIDDGIERYSVCLGFCWIIGRAP